MTIRELVNTRTIVLSDGAWGTEIAKHGIDPGACPELLNVESPDLIRGVAASYVEAGSDIILTNTFGGSPQKLARYGLDGRAKELNEAAVKLSLEAANGNALVLASIGPTGDFLAPLGLTTETQMIETFAIQVEAFKNAGADAVIIETMTDLGEIKCAIKAIKDNSDFEIVASMTYDKGARGYATMMGVTPEQAGAELEATGADVVGSNCGAGIGNMIDIVELLRPSTGLPLWVKPNAGLPELVNGETVYRESPESMAERIPELIEAGAVFIGGCCGTSPEHIRTFRATIDTLQ